jgi:hypothetical protein
MIEVKSNKDVLVSHPRNLTSTSLMFEDYSTDYLILSWQIVNVNYGLAFSIHQ